MRLIVHNPRGGAALWRPRLRAALRVLQAFPGPHALVATEARDMVGPIRRMLDAHPETTQLVACGDGTVAACAAAVGDRRIPIAIVPTGTTNVLAFELGLPANPVRIDVLLLRYRGFAQLARFWLAVLFPGAPHLRLPYVEQVRMRRLRIDGVSRRVEAHLDGEPDLMTPLEVEPLGRVDLLGPPPPDNAS